MQQQQQQNQQFLIQQQQQLFQKFRPQAQATTTPIRTDQAREVRLLNFAKLALQFIGRSPDLMVAENSIREDL